MSLSLKSTRAQELETLVVLAAFFLFLNIMTDRQIFVYTGITLLLIALFMKSVASIISRGWLKFAEVIGTFNSKVILSLVFFLFLTPLAFLYRCFNSNPLMLKAGKKAETFYAERNHIYTKTDLEKMW
jgi:hypothetical protein